MHVFSCLQTYVSGHQSVEQTLPHLYYIHHVLHICYWIFSLLLNSFFIHIYRHRSYVPWWLVHGMFFACLMLESLAPLILEPMTIEDLSKKFPVGPYGTQLQIYLLDRDLRHSLLHLRHHEYKILVSSEHVTIHQPFRSSLRPGFLGLKII